ncbi:MAG TPA: aminoacetone oxidase family FAD-binding enzyme [bacterium]|nr:aminoacetone oxidase family FAD-binding enzyme [bacterium]HQI49018.1 aminoacetone oxidase family FAD-binding enzyme [bacterium]HQJ63433.1 aminoacetone oxidase family FAD-binding enzyme [bacterium]
MEKATIGIVGAGPAGMMAALQAARAGGRVLLFDANPVVGRKLAVTGSGRCNITNSHIEPHRYACDDSAFAARVLERFGQPHLVEFLEGIAVPVYAMADGWCYPRSGSATAVVEAFAAALELAGVEVHTGEKVHDFTPAGEGWILSGRREYPVGRLIVAAGGAAQPNLGSRGELFPILARLGHTLRPSRPALAPVTAEMRRLHKLQGVRMDVGLQLCRGESILAEETGNVIFTQWGLNGPAAMDLSHLISARPGEALDLVVNFVAGAEAELSLQLRRFTGTAWPLKVLLAGLLPPKVARFIVHSAGLDPGIRVKDLAKAEHEVLWQQLTRTRLKVLGTRGLEFAQVSAGGVPAAEVSPETMASCKARALFLAGEVLDVVGPCGGYNLQLAFSTGALAGRAAAS